MSAPVDRIEEIHGFVLGLQQLAIDRIPYYALARRFKPQPFLPRVVENWLKLFDWGKDLESCQSRTAS